MKECKQCERPLPTEAFTKSSSYEDNLSPYCRSCKSYRGRKQSITADMVDAFEARAIDALASAAQLTADSLNFEDITLDDIQANRTLYENFVATVWQDSGLSKLWTYPIWVNPHTLLK